MGFDFERDMVGRPFDLAPAYDMLPMVFAPRAGGSLPDSPPPARLHASVQPEIWRQALSLADAFIRAMRADDRFSEGWEPCSNALTRHVEDARKRIEQLG